MALAIADFTNDKGFAWPAIPTLAKKARLSPRQVKRALDRLQRLGELTVSKKTGPHGVNRYRILLGDKLSPSQDQVVTSVTRGSDICDQKQGRGGDTHVTQSVRREPLKNRGAEVATQNKKKTKTNRRSKTVLAVWKKFRKAGLCE